MGKLYTAFGALCLAALLIIAPLKARGDGYDDLAKPTPVEDLHKSAVKHGGFEKQCQERNGGCPIPMVLLTGDLGAGIDGQFEWQNPTIIKVNDELLPGTLRFNETLVHEFVHQLQFMFGEYGPMKSECKHMAAIEEKAYKAGAAYLAESGVIVDYSGHLAWLAMGFAMCGVEY